MILSKPAFANQRYKCSQFLICDQADEAQLKKLLEDHHKWTGSQRARELLDNWATARAKFVKVFPNEYKRALGEINARKAANAGKAAQPVAV